MPALADFSVCIPARLDSTRLPRKALLDILGMPMIVRVACQAQKSRAKKVYVATDSEEISTACTAAAIPVILTAPAASGTERLAAAVHKLGLGPQEIIVNVQGDEPLIEPSLINEVAQKLQEKNIPMATLAARITAAAERDNPNTVKVVLNTRGEALYFSRSSIPYSRVPEFSKHYPQLRHIGIYAYRVEFLRRYAALSPSPLEQIESLEQLRALWHGYTVYVGITDHNGSIGVDTPADLAEVIKILQQKTRSKL